MTRTYKIVAAVVFAALALSARPAAAQIHQPDTVFVGYARGNDPTTSTEFATKGYVDTAVAGGGGGAVSSVYGRTGAVTAQSGDYLYSQITGAVGGPVSSGDNAICRWDGTSGDLTQSSSVTIDDSGNMSLPGGATVDGRDVSADGVTLDAHVANVSNPHSVTKSQVGLGSVPNVDATNASNLASGTVPSARLDFGTGAGQVCAADDARLSDARTPTAHAASHQYGGSDPIANATPTVNGIVQANGSGYIASGWLDFGSGSGQVCEGNDARVGALQTSTGNVSGAASAAPSAGNVPVALSSSTLNWRALTPADVSLQNVAQCAIDADCDDSLYCDGAETCVGGACQSGTPPCSGQVCDDSTDSCSSPSVGSALGVDSATTYQTWKGSEATAQVDQYQTDYPLYADELFDDAVNDLGISRLRVTTRCDIEGVPPTPYGSGGYHIVNDDSDPSTLNPDGFTWTQYDDIFERIVLPMKRRVEANGEHLWITLQYVCNLAHSGSDSTDLHFDTATEYGEFVDTVEHHVQDTWGIVPDAWEAINEPDLQCTACTNSKVAAGIVEANTRLAADGFPTVWIIPSTTEEQHALSYYDAMVTAQPSIQSTISMIAYHRYGAAPISSADKTNLLARAQSDGVDLGMTEWINATYSELWEDLTELDNVTWQQFTLAYSGSTDTGAKYYDLDVSTPGAPTVTLESKAKLLRQFMKFVRPGATRLGTTNSGSAVVPMLWENPTGRYVYLVKSTGSATFTISGLPTGTYGIKYSTAATYDHDDADQTIYSGQLLNTSIPAAGVITIYQRAPAESEADEVYGPEASVDGNLAAFTGTDGHHIVNSGVPAAEVVTVYKPLTAEQSAALTSHLDDAVGDSGNGGVSGLVPAAAAGDCAAGKVYNACGSYAVPAGGGDVTGPGASTSGNLASYADASGTVLADSGVAASALGTVVSESQGTLLGRGSASGTGPGEEITVGSGLSLSGTTLSATGAGSGDVVGPASSTDNAVARYDLATGKLLQNSPVIIDDSGNTSGMGTLSCGAINGTTIPASKTLLVSTDIGASVQGYDATLQSIAALGTAADKLLYTTGVDTWAEAACTTAGRSMIGAADASAQTALLDAMVGDSGSGGTKGMVPAPGAGDAAAGKYLKANGAWDVPAGGGSGDFVGPASSTDNAVVRFDLATGKLGQNSSFIVDDSGNVTSGGTYNGTTIPSSKTLVVTTDSGSVFQAYDATLQSLSALGTTGDRLAYTTATDTWAEATLTSTGRTWVAAASTAAETAILDAVVGDSGSGGTKGLVPAPGAGDAAAGKYLDADGTWTVPPGSGGVSGPGSSVSGNYASWNGTGGDTLADSGVAAGQCTMADASSDTTTWVVLAGTQTGTQDPLTDSGLTYNASTNVLAATSFTGDLTGNADTATVATNVSTQIIALPPGAADIDDSYPPEWVRFSGTNFPVQGYAFDDTNTETIYFTLRAVNYGSGSPSIDIDWYADTASSGDVVFEAAVSCITPNTDTQDVETDAFATANTVTDSHLGTAGQRLHRATITLSNTDSMAADDLCVLKLDRNGGSGSDTMSGDAIVRHVQISYSTQ